MTRHTPDVIPPLFAQSAPEGAALICPGFSPIGNHVQQAEVPHVTQGHAAPVLTDPRGFAGLGVAQLGRAPAAAVERITARGDREAPSSNLRAGSGSFPPAAQSNNPTAQLAAHGLTTRGKRGVHCAAVLARLRLGPASAADLMAVSSHRFSARIFDLRAQGHRIETTHNPATGQSEFALKGEEQ